MNMQAALGQGAVLPITDPSLSGLQSDSVSWSNKLSPLWNLFHEDKFPLYPGALSFSQHEVPREFPISLRPFVLIVW